jgi:hypothetical protein
MIANFIVIINGVWVGEDESYPCTKEVKKFCEETDHIKFLISAVCFNLKADKPSSHSHIK